MKKVRLFIFLGLYILCTFFNIKQINGAQASTEELKNGIVEIYSGIEENGRFKQTSSREGFLIYNGSNASYIITLQRSSSTKYTSDREVLKVVVSGDITYEAREVASSENQNFSIIQTDSTIYGKNVLKLGNSDEIRAGDSIYTVGYDPSKLNQAGMKYEVSDILFMSGTIQNSSVQTSNNIGYIKNTKFPQIGFSGAPIFNDEFYIVGINDSTIISDSEFGYAIPINDIKTALDRLNIPYESQEKEQEVEKIEALIDESTTILKKGSYTKATKNNLQSEIENAQNYLQGNGAYESTIKLEDLTNIYNRLLDARNQLKKGISTLNVFTFILLVVALTIFILCLKMRLKIKRYEQDILVLSGNIGESKNNTGDYVLKDAQTGKDYYVSRSVSIGRNKDNDIVLNYDQRIARIHCKIEKHGDQYIIFDFKSKNGTYVNRVKLREQGVRLKDKDEIRLSSSVFYFIKVK